MIVQSKISQKFRHSGLDLKRGRNEIPEPLTPPQKRIIEELERSRIVTIGELQDEPVHNEPSVAATASTSRTELTTPRETPAPVAAEAPSHDETEVTFDEEVAMSDGSEDTQLASSEASTRPDTPNAKARRRQRATTST